MGLLARLFGRCVVSNDGPCRIVAYHWRGKIYIWSVKEKIGKQDC